MEEGFEKNGTGENRNNDIYSNAVRAGKRTYFFDVKATKGNDYYLTITESKKRFTEDGKFHFEKHKIFLYKEDFEKFLEGLNDSVSYIKTNAPETPERVEKDSFSDVNFDDLGEK